MIVTEKLPILIECMNMLLKRFISVRSLLILAAAVSFTGVISVIVYYRLPDYSNVTEEQKSLMGTAVLDRNGAILRLFPDGKGRIGLWRDIDSFPKHLKAAVIAAEDQRFYYHPGFDPIAIVRAAYSNIRQDRRVSGASTITQQVVRLIQPRQRTFRSKIIELLCAIKMERQLSKEQILELDLNLSPMGGNIRGAGLAARIYFGKDVENITLPEAAALAALPRSPSRFDPRRRRGRRLLLREKDHILKRMAALGWITHEQLKMSLGSTVVFKNKTFPIRAPHSVDLALENRGEILDLRIQKSHSATARAKHAHLKAPTQARFLNTRMPSSRNSEKSGVN